MPRTHASEFLEALTYRYGSPAVIESGALTPQARLAIDALTRAWPLDVTDTEREAQLQIFRYIEGWYNPFGAMRLSSTARRSTTNSST